MSAIAATIAPASLGVNVTIPGGGLSITTPYSPTNPFQLGTAVLDGASSEFVAGAQFGDPSKNGATNGGVTVTDTRAGGEGWTASATASDFADGSTPTPDTINAENLTFRDVTAVQISGRRMVDSVLLIKALGGGWNAASLSTVKMESRTPIPPGQ